MISSLNSESFARSGFRSRVLAAAFIAAFVSLSVQAQEKRRGLAGRGDFEDTPAQAPGVGAQPGASGPASVEKFELTPRTMPGAVVTPDPKLIAGAPFDTKNYFYMPAEDENAGPLVLDALSDFPEVYTSFNPRDQAGLEQRRKNLKTAQDWLAANPNPRNWDTNAIEQTFGPYRTTFAKLHKAHEKPDCVIPTGVGIETLLPHIQAARMVPQIAAPLIYADLARGDKAGAIEKFADALRLGQDLQPRSVMITALVVSVMHKEMTERVLPILLNARGLKESDYDEILEALKGYRSGSINLLPEALKSDYFMMVNMLDDLVQPGGVDKFIELTNMLEGKQAGNDDGRKKLLAALLTPEIVAKLKAGVVKSTREQLAAIGEIASADDIRALQARLDSITVSSNREALLEVLNKDTVAQLAGLVGESNSELAAALKKGLGTDAQAAAGKIATQLGLNFPGGVSGAVIPLLYFQNDQGIMESLVAIRRWYVTKKSVPSGKTLDEICKEAGLAGAPLDLFTGKPMRMVWTQSGPAVLTAGHDFTDDDGKMLLSRAERAKPEAKGDIVDTLALGGNPTITNQPGAAPGQAQGVAPGAPAGFGQAGAQGGAIRPPGAPGSGSGGSGGRRGRAEGGAAIEP